VLTAAGAAHGNELQEEHREDKDPTDIVTPFTVVDASASPFVSSNMAHALPRRVVVVLLSTLARCSHNSLLTHFAVPM
jgi:hypothetical protein